MILFLFILYLFKSKDEADMTLFPIPIFTVMELSGLILSSKFNFNSADNKELLLILLLW